MRRPDAGAETSLVCAPAPALNGAEVQRSTLTLRKKDVLARLPALLVAGLLAACSSVAQRDAAPARKPGGYYLDDGPHADPPPELDRVPDAHPRVEPIKASTTRPYTVMGRTYVPMAQLASYSATGRATWYGKRYHGKPTASGELYDMYAMTAAHPILPIPSYARVTHLDTARRVVVRVNDRGPFHPDRIIDLSYTAAYKLGMLPQGGALVRVDAILPDEAPAPAAPRAEPREAHETLTPSSEGAAAPAPGIHLQLGAFALRENAQDFLQRLAAELNWLSGLASIEHSDGVYRVQAGPYSSRDAALNDARRIERLLDLRPILVAR
jgi:rare lipoprotein A